MVYLEILLAQALLNHWKLWGQKADDMQTVTGNL